MVRNHQRACALEVSFLRQITRELLQEIFPQWEYQLGIHLVNQKEIIRLNETFLQHQGSTDVITFDYRQPSEPGTLLGEIFICLDEALVQAARFGTSWQNEAVRYLVHGLLHLAGYDDQRPQARRKMKQAENRLLKRLAGRFTLSKIGRMRADRPRPKGRSPTAERNPNPKRLMPKAKTTSNFEPRSCWHRTL